MTPRKPCLSCPWRVGSNACDIPGFGMDLAENLAITCEQQLGAPLFACHQSRKGEEVVCAGWLATNGYQSLTVRMMLAASRVEPEVMAPGDGWPDLYETFEDMIANLRATWRDSARGRQGEERAG